MGRLLEKSFLTNTYNVYKGKSQHSNPSFTYNLLKITVIHEVNIHKNVSEDGLYKKKLNGDDSLRSGLLLINITFNKVTVLRENNRDGVLNKYDIRKVVFN